MSPGLELAEGWLAALERGQPVVAEWSAPAAGLEPQSLASTLQSAWGQGQPFFLLESQGNSATERLSLIAGKPLFVFLGQGAGAQWHQAGGLGQLPLPPELAFHGLGRGLAGLALCEARPGLAPLVGTLAYEAGARFEAVPLAGPEPLGLPQWHFILPEEWACYDPAAGRWRFRRLLAGEGFLRAMHAAMGAPGACGPGLGAAAAESAAEDWAAACARRFALACGAPAAAPPGRRTVEAHSNKGKKAFCAMVRRAQEHIAAGDIYQANLSHRFEAGAAGLDPWRLYQRLAQVNPSPMAAYASTPAWAVVSGSPERLFRQEGDRVEAWPIAGTIARQGDDAQAIAALLASPKDRAEHVMLVDLERNDLGRVCRGGSVQVPELMRVESASHVHHLVSHVRGRLKPGLEFDEVLRAGFPGGSITGAPKIRCMEIIAQLEGEQRGLYTGSLGYWDPWHRQADFNILIRSLFAAEGRVCWQVGAGIVDDSVPEAEWEETLAKAAAMQQALEEA